jgi:glycerophosphoryl diester phosphodiesterase
MPRRPFPIILAHRGYSARYPENTLLAFREAFARGADGIECDVQRSADGRYVVIHDPTVDRVSRSRGAVGAMTLARIRRVDAGRGERIPVLEEVLDALPRGAYIDVELKSETLRESDCGPIADILVARVPRRRLMVSSFEPRLLLPFRARGITVGLLLGEEARTRGAAWLVRNLLVLRPDFLNLPIQIIGPFGRHKAGVLLRAFRALGFSLLFWTVNDEESARAVAGAAAVLVSDEVGRMVRLREGRLPIRS